LEKFERAAEIAEPKTERAAEIAGVTFQSIAEAKVGITALSDGRRAAGSCD
jgi:hypothetical protein